jgi:hypothetical protein
MTSNVVLVSYPLSLPRASARLAIFGVSLTWRNYYT